MMILAVASVYSCYGWIFDVTLGHTPIKQQGKTVYYKGTLMGSTVLVDALLNIVSQGRGSQWTT